MTARQRCERATAHAGNLSVGLATAPGIVGGVLGDAMSDPTPRPPGWERALLASIAALLIITCVRLLVVRVRATEEGLHVRSFWGHSLLPWVEVHAAFDARGPRWAAALNPGFVRGERVRLELTDGRVLHPLALYRRKRSPRVARLRAAINCHVQQHRAS